MPNYNINKIKSRKSYNIKEIAYLLDIDRKTCSRWIKNEGLKVIEENTNTILVMGADLENFIRKKRAKNKTPLKENELYCLKCHKAVIPKIGSERIVKTGKRIGKKNREQFIKKGSCEICGTEINKFLRVCRKD